MTLPTLVAAAHGTKNPDGRATIEALIDVVRARRPDVPIALGFVDVIEPSLGAALAGVAGPAVIVPVLLSTGYHVSVDIPSVVGSRPDTVVAPPLGPDARITRAMWERLVAAGGPDADAPDLVAVVGAGSSDPQARVELEVVAGQLAECTPAQVVISQLTDDDPLADLPATAWVANYLLAPGFFNSKLRELAGPRPVGDPIGAHPLVAEVILDRYRQAAPGQAVEAPSGDL